MNEFCAAYGCTLFGVHGVGGKWYCGCHFNSDHGVNDAITAELHRHSETVERIILARREGRADGELERKLIADVKAAIGQQTFPEVGK